MKYLFYILPVLAGVAMSIQSGVNSQLKNSIQNPLLAAFISFLGGTLILFIMVLINKQPVPGINTMGHIEWYQYTGGLLGAFVVVTILLSVQRIGAANMFTLIVTGQLLTALIMDHFSLLGLKENPITFQRLAGILMLTLGAYLVNRR